MFPLAAGDNPISHVVDHELHGFLAFLGAVGITKQVLFLLIAAVGMLLLFPWVTRRIVADGTGGRVGGFFEVILVYIRDEVVRPFMGKDGDFFLPFIWTVFFFILFCNVLGLIPGSATATANINVTIALAAVAFLFYHGVGIKRNGFFHYVKASLLVGPKPLWPLMILIELSGHMIRPAALAIRLFANMVAGHTMLAVFFMFTAMAVKLGVLGALGIGVASTGAAIAITFLEILVAFIQAFIFTFLTTVFLSMAVHPEH